MFKLISIVVLIYIMYRLVAPAKSLDQGGQSNVHSRQDETIDIDYEEVD